MKSSPEGSDTQRERVDRLHQVATELFDALDLTSRNWLVKEADTNRIFNLAEAGHGFSLSGLEVLDKNWDLGKVVCLSTFLGQLNEFNAEDTKMTDNELVAIGAMMAVRWTTAVCGGLATPVDEGREV